MHESIPNAEQPSKLVERIYALREYMNEVVAKTKQFELFDDIADFGARLRKASLEQFNDKNYLQSVPEWQALVGGSIEPEEPGHEEAKAFARAEIADFVSAMERRLDELSA